MADDRSNRDHVLKKPALTPGTRSPMLISEPLPVLSSWDRMSLLPNEIVPMQALCLDTSTNVQSCRQRENWIGAQLQGIRVMVGYGFGP